MAEFAECGDWVERLQLVSRLVPHTDWLAAAREEQQKGEGEETEKPSVTGTEASTGPTEKTPEPGCRLKLPDPHPSLPALSRAVSVRSEAGRGRFLVAARNIARGEIVAVEQPAVAFPLTPDSRQFCNACHERINGQ